MRVWAWLLAFAALPAAAQSPFDFPRDHHGHAEASQEWWTLFAHVRDSDGDWHAVQASFHRFDFPDDAPEEPWATRALFPAVVAVTDLTRRRFAYEDRVARAGPGSVELQSAPVDLHHRAWVMTETDSTWRLEARVDSLDIALDFRPRRSPLTVWRPDSTSTTSRYVIPRLEVDGSFGKGDVTGVGWLDHVWGDPILPGKETGWELLTIHMRDGSALIIYRTRTVSRQVERRSGGVYLSASGSTLSLEELTPRFYPVGSVRWGSETTEITYPTRWRVEVPSLELDLTVEAAPPQQELNLLRTHGATLWRGSVDVSGKRGPQRVSGAGFLEIVGYGGRFPPVLAARDARRD